MRLLEIANPEDQLALWKLISDKMWAAFAQPTPRSFDAGIPRTAISLGRVGTAATPLRAAIPNAATKSTFKAVPKATKPRRPPMAPAPKPLPKPQQPPSALAYKHKTQQPQQMAQQLQKELVQPRRLQKIQPQPPTPTQKLPTPTVPMAQAPGEKGEGELLNSPPVQHPLNGLNSAKSARSSRKNGV